MTKAWDGESIAVTEQPHENKDLYTPHVQAKDQLKLKPSDLHKSEHVGFLSWTFCCVWSSDLSEIEKKIIKETGF